MELIITQQSLYRYHEARTQPDTSLLVEPPGGSHDHSLQQIDLNHRAKAA